MTDDIVARLAALLGEGGVLDGPAARAREPAWQTHQPCHAKALLLPRSPAEVSQRSMPIFRPRVFRLQHRMSAVMEMVSRYSPFGPTISHSHFAIV